MSSKIDRNTLISKCRSEILKLEDLLRLDARQRIRERLVSSYAMEYASYTKIYGISQALFKSDQRPATLLTPDQFEAGLGDSETEMVLAANKATEQVKLAFEKLLTRDPNS